MKWSNFLERFLINSVLDQQLCDKLGDAHHTCGIYSFVGRNRDEAVGSVTFSGLSNHTRSCYHYSYSLAWIRLHERDVLVRGDTKDNRLLPASKKFFGLAMLKVLVDPFFTA